MHKSDTKVWELSNWKVRIGINGTRKTLEGTDLMGEMKKSDLDV